MAKANAVAGIEPKCRRIADEMGYELVDVALEKEPTGMYLRIYIDQPEGITLDDCEKYHRTVLPWWRTSTMTSWKFPARGLTGR